MLCASQFGRRALAAACGLRHNGVCLLLWLKWAHFGDSGTTAVFRPNWRAQLHGRIDFSGSRAVLRARYDPVLDGTEFEYSRPLPATRISLPARAGCQWSVVSGPLQKRLRDGPSAAAGRRWRGRAPADVVCDTRLENEPKLSSAGSAPGFAVTRMRS